MHLDEKKNMSPSLLNIRFEKATFSHQDIIFEWLEEPHMKEFWDNSQEHKDDILNFIHGRKQRYFYGTTHYWVGFLDNHPFCFLLTDELLRTQDDLTDLHRLHLSKAGTTISLDFGIGNTTFLGKGFAAPTLKAFMGFYHHQIDPKADTFFIDPNESNPRAQHVYEKAGFRVIDKYTAKKGYFIGDESLLMVKILPPKPNLVPATLADYPAIQNMARFYVYDMSRFCGDLPGWECPEGGLYESFDYKQYFESSDRHAFLITVNKEKAGFALINKVGTNPKTDWNMGEFFILAKFQGQGIGEIIANQIFKILPGAWEISVIPENVRALKFWRKVISHFTEGRYIEEIKDIPYDKTQPKRFILSF